jgi:hypothetical protein
MDGGRIEIMNLNEAVGGAKSIAYNKKTAGRSKRMAS